jgi:hypothetical protein
VNVNFVSKLMAENIDKEALVDVLAANVRQQQTEIKALHNLVKEQDKKIIELAFKLAYAERSAQIAYDPKKHGVEE